MFKIFCKLTLAFTLATSAAQAQDLTSWYDGVVANQNAQMQAMTDGIVQQNMNNPQVQAMYQQHRAQGGQYSFEQFCYMYAATGGFTPQGTAYWQQNEANISRQQQQAWANYQNAQAQSAAALQDWRNGYSANQAEAGNIMQGYQTYSTPGGGSQVLPYTWQPGYQSYNNQSYYVDPSYNYYQQTPGGYYQQVPTYYSNGY